MTPQSDFWTCILGKYNLFCITHQYNFISNSRVFDNNTNARLCQRFNNAITYLID